MERIARLGYRCPRWIWDAIQIPATSEIDVPSSLFENNTLYKQRLIYLSFTAEAATPADPPGYWFRCLKLELGKSGFGVQNAVRGSIAAVCANPFPQRQRGGAYNTGRDIQLQTPYMLPRGGRLRVTWWNRLGVDITTYATFVAMGRTISGDPRMLAGSGIETLIAGHSQVMKSADLRNNGRDEMLINRLIFKDFDYYGQGDGQDESGTWLGWQVNPDRGFQWMPQATGIPTGNITPLARSENLLDRGPRVYLFAPDNWLYPDQSLMIRVTNDSAVDSTLNICLHTEVEVC